MNNSNQIMAHLIAGFPDKKGFLEALRAISDSGIQTLELQIPFSDSIADGPIITEACSHVLAQGFRVSETDYYIEQAFKLGIKEVYLMTYANIVYRKGIVNFVNHYKDKKCTGFIVPDFNLDDEEHFYAYSKKAGLEPVPVISINIMPERIKMLSDYKKVYVAIRTGITGSKTELSQEITDFLLRLKPIQIFAGFGIQSSEQIEQLTPFCEKAVVGSYITAAIIKALKTKGNIFDTVKEALDKLVTTSSQNNS